MFRRLIPITAAALLLLTPLAQAVTIDLSSPQEGTTVYPGDTVSMTASITNETDAPDLILVTVSLTADVPGNPVNFEGSFRLPLDAGETAEQTLEFDVPADLQVPAEIPVTISATAVGQESGTEDSDSLSLTLAPLPGKNGNGIDIDMSSPQEGSTVYPGDTVEFTASLSNNMDTADLIVVTITASADIPGNPVSFEGEYRVPLDAGESLSQTFELGVPDLPIDVPVPITIDATAVAQNSGEQDSDSFSITWAPAPGLKDGEGIYIDFSSPQEGTTLHPGDTVEMTATLSNNSGMDDLVTVDVALTADIPGNPFTYEGSFRIPMEDGQAVSETLELDIPADLPLEAPVTVTLTATATGQESGYSDSDTISFTIAPVGKKAGGFHVLRVLP